jgi:hypothetical protein
LGHEKGAQAKKRNMGCHLKPYGSNESSFVTGLFLGLGNLASAQQAGNDVPSIAGRWVYKDDFLEDVTEFRANGSFLETIVSPMDEKRVRDDISCKTVFFSADESRCTFTRRLSFQRRELHDVIVSERMVITAKRLDVKKVVAKASPPPAPPKATTETTIKSTPKAKEANPQPKVRFHLICACAFTPSDRANERAFTVLVPDGWKPRRYF